MFVLYLMPHVNASCTFFMGTILAYGHCRLGPILMILGGMIYHLTHLQYIIFGRHD